MNDAKLYLILDRDVGTYEKLFEILKQSVQAGVDIVQLRDKKGTARDILAFSKQALRFLRGRVPYIINDRVDLALIVAADGVHLGQEDIPITTARSRLGAKAILGTSCQTLAQVRQAQRVGADYIGFGSVFKTLTKPDRAPMDLRLLQRVVKEASIPVFAIGGIKVGNVRQLQVAGIGRVAVCRDICLAENVSQRTQRFKNILIKSKS